MWIGMALTAAAAASNVIIVSPFQKSSSSHLLGNLMMMVLLDPVTSPSWIPHIIGSHTRWLMCSGPYCARLSTSKFLYLGSAIAAWRNHLTDDGGPSQDYSSHLNFWTTISRCQHVSIIQFDHLCPNNYSLEPLFPQLWYIGGFMTFYLKSILKIYL